MFSIIGIVVVFGCIVAGYLMEHGNIKVLLQPAELIIIGGAALGTLLISNPIHILKQMMNGLIGAFGSSKFGTQRYIDSLKMIYELLQKARKEGLVALENDIEEPDKSPLFSKYEDFAKDHHAVAFVCDTMRMAVSGGGSIRFGSDAGSGHGGPSSRGERTGVSVDHHGGLAARAGHCRGGAGGSNHDGRAGRTSGRNWTQGSGGVGRDFSGHSAVLRAGRTAGVAHGQDGG